MEEFAEFLNRGILSKFLQAPNKYLKTYLGALKALIFKNHHLKGKRSLPK